MGAARTNNSVLNALRNSIEFQKARGEPVYEWGSGSVLIFFEQKRSILLGKYELSSRITD